MLLSLIILIPVSVNAEERFKAGTWELSLHTSASDIDISPSIGYFILDNVEAIVHIDYSKITYDFPTGDNDVDSTNYMFEAGVLYNIPITANIEPAIVPFIIGEITYFRQKEDVENSTTLDSTFDGFGIDAGLGIRFLVGKIASINTSFMFGVADLDVDDSSVDVTGYGFDISYSLFFH